MSTEDDAADIIRRKYFARDRARFRAKVGDPDAKGCLPWRAGVFPNKAGIFQHRGRPLQAHRVAWELHHKRPVPEGQYVLHGCTSPGCVNPDHLFLSTSASPPAKADTHTGRHKLTPKKVRNIRKRAEAGETRVSLAQRYGVSRGTISKIVSRKTWSWL